MIIYPHKLHIVLEGGRLMYKTVSYFGSSHDSFSRIHMNNYPHLVANFQILCIIKMTSYTWKVFADSLILWIFFNYKILSSITYPPNIYLLVSTQNQNRTDMNGWMMVKVTTNIYLLVSTQNQNRAGMNGWMMVKVTSNIYLLISMHSMQNQNRAGVNGWMMVKVTFIYLFPHWIRTGQVWMGGWLVKVTTNMYLLFSTQNQNRSSYEWVDDGKCCH